MRPGWLIALALALPASAAGPETNYVVDVRGPGGAPVAGAEVSAIPWTPSPGLLRPREFVPPAPATGLVATRTDGEGRARLAGLAAGRVHLVVRADGMALADVESSWNGGALPRTVSVSLASGASLSGVVRDDDGKPLAGFDVCVSPPATSTGPPPPSLVRRVAAGADGAYRVDGLARGVYEVRTWSERSGEATLDAVRVPEVARFDPEVTLGGTVFGRVLDARTRAPLAGATVTLERWFRPAERVGHANSGADGTYVVRTFRRFVQLGAATVTCPGRERLRVDLFEERRTNMLSDDEAFERDFLLEPQAVEMPRTPVTAADADERPPEFFIRGKVRSQIGAPVAGARVRVGAEYADNGGPHTSWRMEADGVVAADGTFAVPVRPLPTMSDGGPEQSDGLVVCVEAEGHAPALSKPFNRNDEAARGHADVELDAGMTIGGRVTWADTGKPVAGIAIRLARSDEPGMTYDWPPTLPPMPDYDCDSSGLGHGWAEAISGEDGTWSMRHVFPAHFEVEASAPGLAPDRRVIGALAADPIEFKIERVASIDGVVAGPDGAPVVGARVDVAESVVDKDRRARGATSGPGGSFRIPRLPLRPVRLRVTPPKSSSLAPREGIDAEPAAAPVRIDLSAPR